MAKRKQPKSLPKWFILGIIVVTVVAFLWKPYWNNYSKSTIETPIVTITKTPTPTPAWKTYTNHNYDFSFNYPDYLTITQDQLPKQIPAQGSLNDFLSIYSADYKNDLHFDINPNEDEINHMLCRGIFIYNAVKSGSGLEYTKTTGDNSALPERAKCSTFFEAKIYLDEINYLRVNFAYDKLNKNAQADFEKTLSSFKFTQ